MKKLLLSICTILALGLVSCGGNDTGGSNYYENNNYGGSNVNFKGRGAAYRGSCNIRSHGCSIFQDRNGDKLCDQCAAMGYRCHAVDHQPVN